MSKGKGVDVVGDFTTVPNITEIKPNCYDVVISTEMLEHCELWQAALTRMYFNVNPGGLLIITCASTDRLEHGTKRTTPEASPDTTDCYRNISKEDFKSVLPPDLFSSYVLMNARDKQDLQFYGIKK